MNRKWVRLILSLAIGLSVCLSLPQIAGSETNAALPDGVIAKKRLLVLHSYYKGFEWTDLIDRGIGEAMYPFGKDISIYTEYMDLKRFPERQHIASLREVYRIKYSKVRFDAILCTDDHAFQFLLDFRDELFPGTPVVFCGVNDFDPSLLKGHPGFTGKQERLNVKKTIEIALGINPNLKRIIVVADTTPTGVGTLKEIHRVVPDFGRINFQIYDDITMSDLLHQIGQLNHDDAVLLLNFNRDKNGNNFQHSETLALLQAVSKVPIYGVWDFHIGRGIVGGVITSGIELGKVAGNQAIRILSGEKAEKIPIETDFPQQIIFDDAVMKKFGIKRRNLPAETVLINLPMTFYQVNKKLIWTLSGLLIFLSVTTLVLILSTVQRKRAQRALSRAHRALLALNRCKQAMINAKTETELIGQICQVIVEIGGYRRAWIDPGNHAGQPDRTFLPLMIDNRIEGFLGVQTAADGVPDKEEVDLLTKIAENLSYGIMMQRLAVERRKSAQELLLSNEKLSLLLESLPIIPFTCDPADNRISYVSPVIEGITGYPPSAFLGNADFWLDKIHRADKERMNAFLSGYDAEGKRQQQYRFLCADGSYRWFNDIRHLVHHPDQEHPRIVGTWQDITKEKILQEESDQRLQALIQADKLASLGEVVASVAHEINNPNAFISYNIPLLRESWEFFRPVVKRDSAADPQWRFNGMSADDLCGEMDEMIADIDASSQRINRVISELRDFARRDHEEADREIQINDVVRKALSIVGPQIRKSFVDSQLHLAPELPTIRGHFTKLEQVVTNLVVNASQAVPADKRTYLAIKTERLKHCEGVAIHVQDSGSGIPFDVGERVFEPFFTTRHRQGGTGLGLSVSRRLVDEHRGAISYVSRPGMGTRFSVYLPLGSSKVIDIPPALMWIGTADRLADLLRTLPQTTQRFPSVITAATEHEAWDVIQEHPELKWVVIDPCAFGNAVPEMLARIATEAPLLMRACCGEIPEVRAAWSDTLLVDAWLRPPLERALADFVLRKEMTCEDTDRGRRTDRLEVVEASPAPAAY
ncbi:MAG: ABC transporter substrate binding protein [Syntrophales bacterium]